MLYIFLSFAIILISIALAIALISTAKSAEIADIDELKSHK